MSDMNNHHFSYFNQNSAETYPETEIEEPLDPISTEGRMRSTKILMPCTRDRASGEVQLQDNDIQLFASPAYKQSQIEIADEDVSAEEVQCQTHSIIDGMMAQTKRYMGKNQCLQETVVEEGKEGISFEGIIDRDMKRKQEE